MVGGDGVDTLQIIGTNDLTLNSTSTITGLEALNGGGQSILGTSSANIFDLSIFATATNLDAVQGLAGDDTLIGSSFADQLDGGSGNDTLNGGAGNDKAAYGSTTSAVTVSLAVTGAQNTGGAGNDTLIGMDRYGAATDRANPFYR